MIEDRNLLQVLCAVVNTGLGGGPKRTQYRIMLPRVYIERKSQMSSSLTVEAKKLRVDERITLVEEIWDSIAEENGCFELTDAQKQELDRRIQSLQENPQAGRSWEDIRSEFLKSK
jgi:putative addiction module component (TIGR02574 family)